MGKKKVKSGVFRSKNFGKGEVRGVLKDGSIYLKNGVSRGNFLKYVDYGEVGIFSNYIGSEYFI